MPDARYHSITLKLDPMGPADTYKLSFSTMPGMSTSISELRMGDLNALASILRDRNDAASGGTVTAAPRRPAPGEPCPHCGGAGSGCHCDIEYV